MNEKVYIQIGTNDGYDKFRLSVIRDKPDKVILVEPNSKLIDNIKKNYKNIPNVYIVNKAIYYENNKTVELYIPCKNNQFEIKNNKIKTYSIYSDVHFTLVPKDNFGDGNLDTMLKIKSKTITFDKLCSDYNIKNIDFLMIDTEGFDCEIIRMIDLSKYKIQKIIYERYGSKNDTYTKYNKDIAHRLENGFNFISKKLLSNNYSIRPERYRSKKPRNYIATLNKK